MSELHRMPFGAECLDRGGTRFRIWAPAHDAVTLIADGRSLPMTAAGEGWFERIVDDAGPGTRYRYRLADGLEIPDPASRAQDGDVHDASIVVDPRRYSWRAQDWRGRPWHETVLYELHVGTFSPEGTFRGAISHLPHLRDLGVTAVELMPVADFPGRRNWGYDSVLTFAPESAYGTPDDLRALVDAAHGLGLSMFLDVIYNHFGPDGNYLPIWAPEMFRRDLLTPWGPAIDYRLRPARDLAIHNVLYWLEEYRFDGLRFDAVHTIRDEAAEHLLAEIAAAVASGPGRDREVHLVLENERNDPARLTPPTRAQWNDDWHHCCHVLTTGERGGYYSGYAVAPAADLARALAEGFVYQGETPPEDEGPRGEASAYLPATAFVDFLQNHDQIGNRAFGERLDTIAPAAAVEAVTAMLLIQPAIPLLFMGEEWGSRQPFLFFTDFTGDLAEAVRVGRRREFARFPSFADAAARDAIPDPNAVSTFERSRLDWAALDAPEHAARLALVRRLLRLRRDVIVPRLATMPGHAGRAAAVGERGVTASWTFADGSILSLRANLGPDRLAGFDPIEGEVLHASEGAVAGLAEGRLPPWSVVFAMAVPE